MTNPRSLRISIFALALSLGAAPVRAVERTEGAPVIAQLVTRLLEQMHYARRPIDGNVSRQFLHNYLESYDYNHMVFLKSDVDLLEARYGATIGAKAKDGDVDAAYEIYDLALKRLEQRVASARQFAASTFTFTVDESVMLDRHDVDWPKTEAEADDLWRRRIKHEVLVERLDREKARAAKETAAKTAKAEIAKSTAAPVAAAKPAKELSIEETIDNRYDRYLRSYKDYDASDILQDYLTSLAHVYDPHTDYLAPPSKANFDISMKLSLFGIGAVLRSEDGYVKVVSLVPGGPAASSGKLKAEDRIEAVGQADQPLVEVVGMKLDRVVEMIRGEKGSVVRLRVAPHDAVDPTARVLLPLVRDEIKLTDQEAKARVYVLPAAKGTGPKIGVLEIPSFYADMHGGADAKSLTRDVERLLGELRRRSIDALVIDLRHNAGGSLSEAVSLGDQFIKDGPIVQVKDSRGGIRVLRDTDGRTLFDGPIAVITSRGSASAAEIFAAAMQDYGRAVLVGDKSTFGKGTVQSVLDLKDYLPPAYRSFNPGALKLTVQKFYRVSGASTQVKGVVPDIHLPSGGDLSDMTESSQKSALPYDEIEPAPFVRSGQIDGRIPSLAKTSAARVTASQEFSWIREDLARWEKQKADKNISLNEKVILSERKEEEDRAAARKKIRIARHEKPLKFDEITLASLDGKGPAVSTATVAGTTPAADDDEEFARAPDAPDVALEEAVHVAADLSTVSDPSAAAGTRKDRAVTR